MERNIYIIRHCKAEGQTSEASLTNVGFDQAVQLAHFFRGIEVERIISSPFVRAVQSVEPLSKNKNVPIEIDSRLSERVLSTEDMPDWLMKLEETFINLELKLNGGESSQEAMNRIVEVLKDLFESSTENAVIVSHGNIISLLLMNYNQDFGFDTWKSLSNPDVYKLSYSNNECSIERIWLETEMEAKGS